jgi:hypothetical protein
MSSRPTWATKNKKNCLPRPKHILLVSKARILYFSLLFFDCSTVYLLTALTLMCVLLEIYLKSLGIWYTMKKNRNTPLGFKK